MGKFQKLTNPSNKDLIPIIDIDGGIANRPVTKLIERGDLLGQLTSGLNGESAYEIAVRLGFQGTEQQWLESLKGGIGGGVANSILTTSVNLSVNSNSITQIPVTLGNTFMLLKATTNLGNTRVRLYLNQAFANADLSRAIGGTLATSHGLIYDAVFTSVLSLDVLPCAIASPQGSTILVVNNLATIQQDISLTFNYLQLT